MANTIKLKTGSGSDPSASDLIVGEIAIRTDSGKLFTKKDNGTVAEISGGGGIDDGDKGDITVSNGGDTFTIDNDVVTFAKLENVENNRILGRVSSGAGNAEELTQSQVRTLLNVENGATADQTASEILTLIKTVDGTGSGLNADLLDGIDSSQFLRSDAADSCSAVLSFTAEIKFGQSYSDPESGVQRDAKFGDNGIAVVGGIKTDTLNATGNISCGGTVDGVDIAARNTLFGGLTSSSGVLTNGVTATTQSAGNNTTRVATTAFVSTAISNLINGAPSALDTLNELAAAMNDDAAFSTTVTNSLATKMPLAGGQFTGNITFSGSQTVDGRDLSVDGSKLDGIESGATADQTASEILTLLKTVDGAGSGLDADLLDGISSTGFFVQSGSWLGDLGSNGFTRENGLAMTGGAEFVILSKSGQGHVLIDGSYHAYEGGAFYSYQNSSFSSQVGFFADSTSSAKWKGHLKPNADSSQDLGSSSLRWSNLYADTLYGAGSNITALNASNISSGTISDARLPNSISSSITGNAATATKLASARTIAGVSFDGSANISLNNNAITNGAGYITSSGTAAGFSAGNASNLNSGTIPTARISDVGSTEAYIITFDNLEKSNFSSDGELGFDSSQGLLLYRTQQGTTGTVTVLDGANVDAGTGISITNLGTGGTATESFTFSLANHSADLLTSGTVADARLPSSISSDITGNAATATILATARTIAGVSFNGSANISLNNNAITNGAGYITSSNSAITNKLPLSGGTMTGELQINARLDVGDGNGSNHEIRIFKEDNNVSDHIQFYNGTTRIGEIGCEDTTWLRINQETAKNIYTPRYIRADNGFFVDGTSKGINGSGNFIGGTIAGASDYSTLLRSNADDTASGIITLSSSSRDCLNFSANSTDDNRGLAFNGRIAISADYNDGYLRLNNASEFGNGVYTPLVMRADNGFQVDGTTVINGSAQLIASRLTGALPAIDGSALTGISAGATGGGSDEVFYENGQTVTTNYTITNGKNAMAAGPITINSGVTVTVGSGETLTIV